MESSQSSQVKPKISSAVESVLYDTIIGSEYRQAKSNNSTDYSDYEAVLDMVEGIRSEKNYSWQSDVNIPMFWSHLATDASSWAAQYFQSRDFVDIYLEGDQPQDSEKCKAAKVLLNRTLNMRQIYHYQKYIRARMINWLFGQVYVLCWWERKTTTTMVPQLPINNPVMEMGPDGRQMMRMNQIPQPDKQTEKIIYDRFNYEVLDPRNVFTDFKYAYSIQEKDWVIIRTEKTYEDIIRDEDKFGYFNLDKIRDYGKDTSETRTSQETYNKYDQKMKPRLTPRNYLDILDRYGSMYCIVDRDESGDIIKASPGYDDFGEVLPEAELIETIITYAGKGDSFTMIGFRHSEFIDANGEFYKPLVRGWCYIHPAKDIGLGDGKNLRELQVALNDTFNISNDRVMLATLPTFKGRKMALEDNPTVYIEPEHIIELENPREDLEELRISDNIQGALSQISMIKGEASEVDSIWPTTMGGLPEKSSTTATAVAGAETRTNVRGNFKSLTFEYTYLVEFYNMVQQMTYRFAKPETAQKLMGDLSKVFDPAADYTYVPLSQNIEAEFQKNKKVQNYDQMIGRLSGLAKISPQGVIPIIAHLIALQCETMGSDYRTIAPLIENMLKQPPVPEGEQGKGAEQTADGSAPPNSNQNGVPQSGAEQDVRESGEIASAGGGVKHAS